MEKFAIEEFLQSILNRCLDILESDVGSILLLDKTKGDIVVRVARGKHKQSILGERIRLGEGIAGLVAFKKEPLLVEDVRKEQSIIKRCRMGNYRTNSFLSVPIMNAGKLIGVMNITEKANGKPFTIKELSFVSAISGCAAESIEQLAHCENLEKQLKSFKDSTAVTKFTSSIAHELNNPLDGLLRYTGLCLNQANENSALKEYLLEIKLGLQRMADIVRGMLEFSFAGDIRCNPVNREQVDINSVIEKVVSFYKHQALCRRIRIETKLDRTLPRIVDYGFYQVFMNFIKNSFEAMNEEGALTISSYRENGYMCIEFIDTGIGVEESIKNKIFEPFFSTKPAGKGLGLAIVKEIINCYEGTVEVESVSQGGAKFKIIIPMGGN